MLTDLHSGHRGIEGTKATARLAVYWPQIDAHLKQFVKGCRSCQFDRPIQPAEPTLHLPKPERAFQYVSADIADMDGKKFLVIADWYLGWFTVHQMRKNDANSTIYLLRGVFKDTAVPHTLYSDNGPPS